MTRLLLSLIIIFVSILKPNAQNALPIGHWRVHLPYRIGSYVTQSPDKIYYSTGLSIIMFDKEELSTEYLTRVNGLSNATIGLIKYNSFSDILVVVYKNSVIDLVKPGGEIVTMSQIRNFSNFAGDKSINDIYVENEKSIFLAAGYGISKLNLQDNEFSFTTFTGVPVRGVIVFDGYIYASTDEGIYRTSVGNANPDDFSNWQFLDESFGFPLDYNSKAITSFDGKLYMDVNGELYRFENNEAASAHTEPQYYALQYLTAEGARLLAGYRCIGSGCGTGKMVYFNADGSTGTVAPGCFGVPVYGVEDERGRLWFADEWRNFRMINHVGEEICTYLSFDSPYSEQNWDLAVHNSQVWIAAGALNQTLSNRYSDHGFYSLSDGKWTIYNRWTRDEFKGENPSSGDDDFFDVVVIAPHPSNGKVYAGSFYAGLAELDAEGRITIYNQNNSTLQDAEGDAGRVRVSGLAFDKNGDLWISNHTAVNGRPVSLLKTDGSWQNFSQTCGQDKLFQAAVDLNGYKWFIVDGEQAGVLVFDERDPDDPGDDRCRAFTANNSNLPTNNTFSLAADLDGNIWVGTGQGVVIFECGGSVFEPECRGSRRIVEQDGFGAYLLETEEVLAIAVDGTNRKWVGTRNGVYVLSPNGNEQIARFTDENSPLLDNNILDIAIDQETGEVFIGTNAGVISYQSDAVAGDRVHRPDIQVYPNPVRPGYEGPIAIKGLARDAIVKITDINGQLVYETNALGGQAIWDGRDYKGRRANSGVYLVFSSLNPRNAGFNSQADGAVAKIVFIR